MPHNHAIFISYRRVDASGHARALHRDLCRQFAKELIFFDRESIESGDVFPEELEKAVAACRVLLALIGPEWLQTKNADGLRCLDDPHDFVRQEIAQALAQNKKIIPVLFDDTLPPAKNELPAPLKTLASCDVLTLRGKAYEYDTQLAELVRLLVKVPGVPKPVDPKIKTIHDLSETVRENIADLLEESRLKALKASLGDILKEKKKTIVRTSVEIAAKLVAFEIFDTLPLLYMARKNAVATMEKRGTGDDVIQWVLTRTRDILGWLVLLAVNTAWISENREALHPETFPGAIELPVKTDTGIEIVHAVLNKRCAQFDIAEGTLFGTQRMPPIGHEFLEAGFDTDNAVSEVKRSIYAYLSRGWGKETVPGEVTPDLEEELNSQLQWWNELNETRYLVVERSDCSHPLNNEAVYNTLLRDLPDLRVIFHNTGKESTAFRISEIRLSTTLRNFFLHR